MYTYIKIKRGWIERIKREQPDKYFEGWVLVDGQYNDDYRYNCQWYTTQIVDVIEVDNPDDLDSI